MPGAALRGFGRAYLKRGGSPAWTRSEGKSESGGLNEKDFAKLKEVKNMGGMVDKRSPFKGGGIAYAGGGKARKRGKV